MRTSNDLTDRALKVINEMILDYNPTNEEVSGKDICEVLGALILSCGAYLQTELDNQFNKENVFTFEQAIQSCLTAIHEKGQRERISNN